MNPIVIGWIVTSANEGCGRTSEWMIITVILALRLMARGQRCEQHNMIWPSAFFGP